VTEFNPLAPSGTTVAYKKMEIGPEHAIQGIITDAPRILPQKVYGTDTQATSAKGNPLWIAKVVFEQGGETKQVYLEKSAYFEFINAIKALGIRTMEAVEGLAFGILREADEPSKTAGFAPRKNFKVVLKKV
jgi:hypothetical protein